MKRENPPIYLHCTRATCSLWVKRRGKKTMRTFLLTKMAKQREYSIILFDLPALLCLKMAGYAHLVIYTRHRDILRIYHMCYITKLFEI